jgi:hypothetical protein
MKFIAPLMAATVLAFAGTAQAQVLWYSPQAITGPSDISVPPMGYYVDAIGVNDFGGSPYGSSITIGDTTFNPFFSDPGITISGPFAGGTDGSGSNSTPYNAVLNGVAFTGFTPTPSSATITMNNLTIGDFYQVQVWNRGGRLTDITGANTVTLSDEYTLGTFVAGATSQSFIFTSRPNDAGEIGAVALREIPEPSAFAMMLGGLALLGFCLRRKRAGIR